MLTDNERHILAKKIKEFTVKLKDDVDKQYPDDYKQSPLIDRTMNTQKNEIVRKIKFY